MGFYGNILNTTRSQFVFDKRYSNRLEMDANANSDSVYIGRYVLVDYDYSDDQYLLFNMTLDNDKILHLNLVDGDSSTYDYEKKNFQGIRKTTIKVNMVIYPLGVEHDPILTKGALIDIELDDSQNIIKYSAHNPENYDKDDNFLKNYQADYAAYNSSRGYDSTVWQKVVDGSQYKYVMVAELNTVVPTFDITQDPPSIVPVIPHFDADSTNVYYKLHWQPQWGFRVAAANKNIQGPVIDPETGKQIPVEFGTDGRFDRATTNMTTRAYNAKSDQNIIWKNSFLTDGEYREEYFNPTLASWSDTPAPFAGAIYFNKAGFNPEVSLKDKSTEEGIFIEPTGISGNLYSPHNGGEKDVAVDTYELSVMLPSLGNAVSDMWDVVYGKERNLHIDWENADGEVQRLGDRLIDPREGYSPKNVKTLAGCINSVHDLMGMIIMDDVDTQNEDAENYDDAYIYHDDGKYYRKREYSDFAEDGTTVPNMTVTTPITSSNQSSFGNKLEYFDSINLTGSEYYRPSSFYTPTMFDLYLRKPEDSPNATYYTISANAVNDLENGEGCYKWSVDENGVLKFSPFAGVKKPSDNIVRFTDGGFKSFISTGKLIYVPGVFYIKDTGNYTLKNDDSMFINQKLYLPDYPFASSNITNNTTYEIYYVQVPEARVEAMSDADRMLLYTQTSENVYTRNDGSYVEGTLYYYKYIIKHEEELDDNKVGLDIKMTMRSECNPQGFDSNNMVCDFTPYVFFRKVGDEYISLNKEDILEYYNKGDNILFEDVYTLVQNMAGGVSTEENKYYHPNWFGSNILEKYLYDDTKTNTEILNKVEHVWTPNTYYIKNGNDYLVSKDFNTRGADGKIYLVEKTKVGTLSNKVYAPNTYYVKNAVTNTFELCTSSTAPGETLYQKKQFYVQKDSSGAYPPGMPWPPSVKIPAGVELSMMEEKADWKELEGFGTGLNTIHGLILQMNKVLEDGDKLTRDDNTVQGAINKLKDILIRFEDIQGHGIMAVDDYGRIICGKVTGDEAIDVTYPQTFEDGFEFKIGHKNVGSNGSITIGDFTLNVDKYGHVEASNLIDILKVIATKAGLIVGGSSVTPVTPEEPSGGDDQPSTPSIPSGTTIYKNVLIDMYDILNQSGTIKHNAPGPGPQSDTDYISFSYPLDTKGFSLEKDASYEVIFTGDYNNSSYDDYNISISFIHPGFSSITFNYKNNSENVVRSFEAYNSNLGYLQVLVNIEKYRDNIDINSSDYINLKNYLMDTTPAVVINKI